MGPVRKLSAIMFSDIVDYTSMMGEDESLAYKVVQINKKLHQPIIDKYGGILIKELGDGLLITFKTATEAVLASKEIMEGLLRSHDYHLRIGVHMGEVIEENNDVFGDGVNIAARIQSIAEPDTIYISDSIYNNISNKKNLQTQFLKNAHLKNVAKPIGIYKVFTSKNLESIFGLNGSNGNGQDSIAVLPFINMSSDPEQEYFCDGITEEIINTLTQLDNLRVIARTSAFSFKNKNIDIRDIGRLLEVDTLLEGSVRKASNKIRITTNLINARDGDHLWSDKYDHELKDIFKIQEDIATNVVKELKGFLTHAEKLVVKPKVTNIKAYDYFLKGKKYYHDYNIENSLLMFKKVIEIDPLYAPAFSGLADVYSLSYQWYGGSEKHLSDAEKHAITALRLAPNLAESHTSYAFVLQQLRKYRQSEKEYKKAMKLNPNYFDSHYLYARFLFSTGKIKDSIAYFKRASEIRKEDFQSLILMVQSLSMDENKIDRSIIDETRRRLLNYLEIDPTDRRALSLGSGFIYIYEDKTKGVEMIEKAVELYPNDAGVIFNGACLYALMQDKARAMDLLELAVQGGFGHKDWLEHDTDYDLLRDEPRFKALMATLK